MKTTKIIRDVVIFAGMLIIAAILSGHLDVTRPKKTNTKNDAKVIEINQDQFIDLVFDYKSGKEWKFTGEKPVVIDFYATWCGPCKRLRPRLDQLAREYGDDIVVYSIDAELAPQLSAYMGVDRFPTLFFVPLTGTPYKSIGLLPLNKLRKGVEKILPKE